MTDLVLDLNAISQAAVQSDNTSVDSSGFVKEIAVEGPTLCRIREYVELGRHAPSAAGALKGWKPALKGYLVIELLHKKHIQEMGDKLVPHEVKIFFNKAAKATSNYKKLFKQINAATGGSAQTFVDLVGKPFKAKVVHNVVGTGEDAKTYVNLENYDTPQRENDDGDLVDIVVPELMGKVRLFLWENASVSDEQVAAMWESIYNDRTYTKNAGKDNETEESMNWDQEKIMAGLDWEDSRTKQIVASDDIDLGDAPEMPEETVQSNDEVDF